MITPQLVFSGALAAFGLASAAVAVFHERRMQRHRLPGVTYAQVTLRRDGGWCREDLFAPEGLAHQRQASKYGILAAVLWLLALLAFILVSS